MKAQKKEKALDFDKPIKLRIDHRTIITIRTKGALKLWKEKYPQATEVL